MKPNTGKEKKGRKKGKKKKGRKEGRDRGCRAFPWAVRKLREKKKRGESEHLLPGKEKREKKKEKTSRSAGRAFFSRTPSREKGKKGGKRLAGKPKHTRWRKTR